jgi:pimeloyl-ACP methyl ester carboxylesterase
MAARKRFVVAAVALLILISGHARPQSVGGGITPIKPANFSELERYLRDQRPDVDRFRMRGPFGVDVHENYRIAVSTQRSGADLAFSKIPDRAPKNPSAQELAADHIVTDLFLSRHTEQAPLVIFMHGYAGSRVTHFEQAMHVATWGMHSLTLRLLNDSEWGTNGRTVARLVRFLANPPGIMRGRIHVNKIVLVGYSFGGLSTSVALALGAPVAGAILLDPATIGTFMPDWLPLIKAPVLVIGADERVAQANNRAFYFQNMGGAVAEVSVSGATHEDAQSSSDAGLTTKELQITFISTVVASAFSLSSTGSLEYAWSSFTPALRDGKLFNARRR